MNLEQAITKHRAKQDEFQQLKTNLKAMGGDQLRDFVLAPAYAVMQSRSELVRDVCASIAQRIIEQEALKIMTLEGEARDSAVLFLSENPAAYLRQLTKQVVQGIHQLPVAKELQGVINGL